MAAAGVLLVLAARGIRSQTQVETLATVAAKHATVTPGAGKKAAEVELEDAPTASSTPEPSESGEMGLTKFTLELLMGEKQRLTIGKRMDLQAAFDDAAAFVGKVGEVGVVACGAIQMVEESRAECERRNAGLTTEEGTLWQFEEECWEW